MAARRSVVSVLLAAVLLGAVVLAPACSNDNTIPTVAEMPTTTDPKAAADILPAPTPLPAGEIVAALEGAVTAKDFCALLTAVDVAVPKASDRPGAIAVYKALASAAGAGRAFVPADPPELRGDWQVVVTGVEAAADAVEQHDGDVTDPEVEAALESTDMIEAIQNVERYQLQHCPPPTPAG